MNPQKNIHLKDVTFNEIDGAHNAFAHIHREHAIVIFGTAVVVRMDQTKKMSVINIGLIPGKGALSGVILSVVIGLLLGTAGIAFGVFGGILGAISFRKAQKNHQAPKLKRQIQERLFLQMPQRMFTRGVGHSGRVVNRPSRQIQRGFLLSVKVCMQVPVTMCRRPLTV